VVHGVSSWLVDTIADTGGVACRGKRATPPVPGPHGGVFRPFEEGDESWAELVLRTSRAIVDLAHQHHGGTVVLVGHSETVESSFHALAAQPLYRAFDVEVAPASLTEWVTDCDPTGWPPPRWTLCRFNDARRG